VVVSTHLCYAEDGRFISPIKSKPHCMKGASNEINLSGRGCNFLLPSKILHSRQLETSLYTFVKIVGQY
jgi:hypothetical protein